MATASTKVGRAKGAYLLVLLNIFFAVLAVIGQVAQNVSLPLWIGATSELEDPNCTDINITAIDASNSSYTPAMDPFFVLSFASLSFVVIFGAISLVIIVIQLILNHLFGKDVKFITMKDDILFPQWQFVLVGVFDALNGVFVVFAADPSRTAPFLQAILGNFIIPLTILFRCVCVCVCACMCVCVRVRAREMTISHGHVTNKVNIASFAVILNKEKSIID